MIDPNKLRSIVSEYSSVVGYKWKPGPNTVKAIEDINSKIKEDIKENWNIYNKVPQLNPVVFSDALEIAERGLTGQATYTVSELNKAIRELNQMSMMLWGDRCAKTVPSLDELRELRKARLSDRQHARRVYSELDLRGLLELADEVDRMETEELGPMTEEPQEETKTLFGTGGVSSVTVRKRLKKSGSTSQPATALQYQIFLDQIGACMSQLQMYLKTSRCKIEDKSDPNVVKACVAFDYAAKFLERKRLLTSSVDMDYDDVMRLVLRDTSDEEEENENGESRLSEVKPSLIIRDDYVPRNSVYPELKAIAEKDKLVIHLDADREAVIDYKTGTLAMKNASVDDVPVARLFKSLGLECEDSINDSGEKLMVCKGVNESNVDKVAIGVATTANTHLRRFWGEYDWPEDAFVKIANKISSKFSEALNQLRK
ncbi:MAG: hypothetical protein JHC26_06560 [Thermofilum sp.]|uniref:hypothetical protein n=1 Tax=Thermofilum sp. TaxID=1961369 RepID=UPI00258C0517|nr:hypothetical protein [Thermofilum sp.]MCI4408735.1 hypothetical protein [Thermofilum sp.]